MANEFLAQITPTSFFSETSIGQDQTVNLARVGDFVGLSMRKNSSFTQLIPISHANTFTTGITLTFYTVDDGTDAADLGKVVRYGITPKRIVNGESVDIDTGAASETTLDVTLESTAGNITVNTSAIANAALDSLASGEALALRIRRVGTATQDTCNNRVILLGVAIKNT